MDTQNKLQEYIERLERDLRRWKLSNSELVRKIDILEQQKENYKQDLLKLRNYGR